MDDGFVTFCSKRSKWRKRKSLVHRSISLDNDCEVDNDVVREIKVKLANSVMMIQESGLGRSINNLLKKEFNIDQNLVSNISLSSFVTYSLGSFTRCSESLLQLALLVFLRQYAAIQTENWIVYDPVFNANDKLILKNENFQILSENDFGRRTVTGPAIFYLPHCPLPLMHNILWSNLANLNQVKILGNSITSIDESLVNKEDRLEYYVIDHLINSKLYRETRPCYSEILSLAFHGISLHSFSDINVEKNFSEQAILDPPKYSDNAFSSDFIL